MTSTQASMTRVTRPGSIRTYFCPATPITISDTRDELAGKQIVYVVAGTGGMPRQPVIPASGQPVENSPGVTYEAALSSLGYLYVTASLGRIAIEFWKLGANRTKASDSATINLATGRVS